MPTRLNDSHDDRHSAPTSEAPPGPAALLGDAIIHPESPPPTFEPLVEENGGASENTSGTTTRTGSPGPGGKPTSTTTVTTVSHSARGKEDTTTETITHVGTSTVASEFRADGSFHLRPIPARGTSGSKIKSTSRRAAFTPRTSAFDRDNPDSQKDPFRGFYTLFWITVAVAALRTGVRHYNEQGVVWGRGFATLISEDGKVLAVSDAVMVASTFLCVPFVKMIQKGWISYYWTGAIIQHALQTLFLALAVRWTFHRHWPWVQSGFMTLHTLSMLMKIHSYCSYNGELSAKAIQLRKNQAALEILITASGGREKAEAEARSVWEHEVSAAASDASDATDEPHEHRVRHKEFEPNVERAVSGAGLVRRRSRARRESTNGREGVRSPSVPRAKYVPTAGLEVLTWHHDDRISQLAIESAVLQDALVSTGVNKVVFPANVGYASFFDYLLVPTLVYQLEYPRTKTIRPLYIVEKSLATLGTFSLLVLIVEHYILPISPSAHQNSFFITVLDLAIPFMINYLLIFYIIFECICNLFAEVTRFADREFYQDWWNSTSFDEFSRRWNVPVHAFLLRHVYTSSITTYNFSKFQAAFVTFLLSALVHELVMAVVTQKLRLYLFLMQMAQLPLIMFGRLPIFRQYPALGNLFFWIGLLSGFPLLAVAYIRF